jgi:DNA-binding MarR family transcriptional regulator
MTATANLRPTLWRTCRVLANRRRLRILGCLLQQPGQTVSAVSHRLRLSLSATSQCLRALEARGILVARRKGSYVSYHPGAGETAGQVAPLAAALRVVFEREPDPTGFVFRAATAFTHPRRVALVQALAGGAQTLPQLHDRTKISVPALLRHLAKLEARGFLVCSDGVYTLVPQRAALPRALAGMACG